jgi:hypothetical protein
VADILKLLGRTGLPASLEARRTLLTNALKDPGTPRLVRCSIARIPYCRQAGKDVITILAITPHP